MYAVKHQPDWSNSVPWYYLNFERIEVVSEFLAYGLWPLEIIKSPSYILSLAIDRGSAKRLDASIAQALL